MLKKENWMMILAAWSRNQTGISDVEEATVLYVEIAKMASLRFMVKDQHVEEQN
jgi:hypothetical protein